MRRYLMTIALGVSLLGPSIITAQDHDRPKHEWNDQEKDHWHQYLNEHHKKDHDWEKSSKREQKAYWKWRDAHQDNEHHDQDHHDH